MRNYMICALVVILSPNWVMATSSGLNNIPTADTPPDRVVVFQTFANWTDGQDDYFVGMKMGLQPEGQIFEWGVDGRVGENGEGPAVFQVKYVFKPFPEWPKIAIGAANIAVTEGDRKEAGQAFKFVLMTHDLKFFRGHAGYGFQQNNNAAFFGVDKTMPLFGRDFMFRSDFIQIGDQDQWLSSFGFIYFVHDLVAIESWISEPLEHGESVFTLKFNFIFKL